MQLVIINVCYLDVCILWSCNYLLYFVGLGFGGDADNPHLPHNHEANQVVYTGTHDNDTVIICLCPWNSLFL